MIAESKLKADCTPEIIKKMVELAEGFKYPILIPDENDTWERQINLIFNWARFPLLIHRAVEGWNKITRNKYIIITDTFLYTTSNLHQGDERYNYNNYQTQSLTHCECACLHCLIEVLK